MADLMEDISRDLDSGRFDILPSTEGMREAGPAPQRAEPPLPVSSRLQASHGPEPQLQRRLS